MRSVRLGTLKKKNPISNAYKEYSNYFFSSYRQRKNLIKIAYKKKGQCPSTWQHTKSTSRFFEANSILLFFAGSYVLIIFYRSQ